MSTASGGALKHHRRTAVVGVLAALSTTLIGAVAQSRPAAAAESYPVPAGGVYQFSGHGYGHGRGMSQWGADGMAAAGQTAEQILSFYYPGTQDSTLSNPNIRVSLSAADGSDVTIAAGVGNEYVLDNGHGGARTDLPTSIGGAAVSQWQAARTAGGTIALSGFWQNAWHPYPTAAPLVTAGPLRFGSDSNSVRMVFADHTEEEYQGFLDAVIDGTTLRAVNTLPLEQYLDGVVPHEAVNSWPAAALQAQAIAARSYAAARLSPSNPYDICDTTTCQVYTGIARYDANGVRTPLQYAQSDAAVSATANIVRVYNGAIISAEYSSSDGGWTVDGGVAYKPAEDDPWDTASPFHDWTATVSQATIQSAYPSIGTLTGLVVNSRDGNGDWGGRVQSVTVQGTATSVTVTGGAFQAALGLKSTWWSVGTAAAPSGGYLHTMSPARLLDTRTGGSGAFAPGESRTLAVAGVDGIPADAIGAVLNVTATDTTSASYLTVWPAGGARPNTSNLNWDRGGQTVANLVYTELGNGGVSIYNNQGNASVVVDVFGYFEPAGDGGGLAFQPVTPGRLLDTRSGAGGPAAPLGPKAARSLTVAGSDGVAANAAAVVANLTVTQPSGESYLTMWPGATPMPATSNINMLPGETRANAALAVLGNGGVSLYNNAGTTQAILDVLGEYLPGDGTTGQYVGIQPSRLLDTRTSTGGHPAPMAPGETYQLPVLGRGGVPSSGVSAVVLNVTAVAPNATTYVTSWAAGTARPGISNLNADPGAVVPNLVIAAVGAGGAVDLYNNAGSTGLVVDVVGWISG